MIGTDNLDRVIGADVVDSEGSKIGTATEIYLDDESGNPQWVTVKTGLFGSKQTFVPVGDADLTDDGVKVPVTKEQVKDAPRIDADGHLSPEEETELYRFYGLEVGSAPATDDGQARADDHQHRSDDGAQSGAQQPARSEGRSTADDHAADREYEPKLYQAADGQKVDGEAPRSDADEPATTAQQPAPQQPAGDDSTGRHAGAQPQGDGGQEMTLSEERATVSTERRPTERVRLRKHVVTEYVTQTIPVTREEVRLERVPIDADGNDIPSADGAGAGVDAGEEVPTEVTLYEERPVVRMERVPVERVRLATETVTEDQQISTELRREELEVDRGPGSGDVEPSR